MSRQRRRRAYGLGRRAEWMAAWWLRLKGYRILARDFRVAVGEIDLIARRGRTLALVEVKARPDLATAQANLATAQSNLTALTKPPDAPQLLAAQQNLSSAKQALQDLLDLLMAQLLRQRQNITIRNSGYANLTQ